jgi:LacI family transcriptional regulator
VSRVLNNSSRVAPDTAERVQRAIEELGYRPNVFAQGLITRKSRLLGLLLPDIHGEFYSEVLRGADTAARSMGYHVLVSSDGHSGEAAMLSSNIAGMLAGVAVMITEPNAYLIRQAGELELPVVVIDKDVQGERVDRVLVDNRSGVAEAVGALMRTLRPDALFFLGGPESNFDTQDRAAAFIDATGAGDGRVQFGQYTVEWGFKAAQRLLKSRAGRPTGVLAGNDEIALGVLQAAQAMGVDVPGQLQIVGFDDTRIASMVRPQLSAVRVPMADVGEASIRLLVERLASPDAPARTVVLRTALALRGTTAKE